jgi:glycosyltransferase involved in cell wall biosynthesis
LDSTSCEGARAAWGEGVLGEVVCFANHQDQIPRRQVRSLSWHPVRVLSNLGSKDYYGAKKQYTDWIASRRLRSGRFDLFHGWSGDSFRSLVEARLREIPSVIDIPTWHRNKGHRKSSETERERAERLQHRGWRDWRKLLPVSRVQMLAEYDLADTILVPSRRAGETFLAAGVPEQKLHYVGRGVDPSRYAPGAPPEEFRACFVGALIKRKGVHHLLAAWRKLALKNASLVLVGAVHDEIKPFLADAPPSVRVAGFSADVREELARSAVFVFPSECEGFAKATLEAAACALPLIATRESGDAVVHGETGWIVPPNDPDALAGAIKHFHDHREAIRAMGLRGRERVLAHFTWDHYRRRTLHGYAAAMRQKQGGAA